MKPATLCALLLGASLLVAGCEQQSQTASQTGAEVPVKGVDRSRSGDPAPDIAIIDAEGEPASLADSTGRPMLVNIWATWCAPCVKELPTLDSLAARPGALRVIAVSQDVAPRASVEAFLDRHGIGELEAWRDPEMALSDALGAQVLPTTVYYDSAGREVWRFIGDLDWTGEQAAALLAEGGRRPSRSVEAPPGAIPSREASR